MTHKNILPSMFTLLNAFLGFWAVIKVTEGEYLFAAWFIILAVLCDGMDGKLARLAGCNHPLGTEMDSLADLVSFGVAPAFLIYKLTLIELDFPGIMLCFLYLTGGIYRLARFNIIQKGERNQGYQGLPIPVAAMTVSALVLMLDRFHFHLPNSIWSVFILIISGLMVSTIPYNWPSLQFGNIRETLYSILLLICVGAMLIVPSTVLFSCMVLYILFSIGNVLINSYIKVYMKQETQKSIKS